MQARLIMHIMNAFKLVILRIHGIKQLISDDIEEGWEILCFTSKSLQSVTIASCMNIRFSHRFVWFAFQAVI